MKKYIIFLLLLSTGMVGKGQDTGKRLIWMDTPHISYGGDTTLPGKWVSWTSNAPMMVIGPGWDDNGNWVQFVGDSTYHWSMRQIEVYNRRLTDSGQIFIHGDTLKVIRNLAQQLFDKINREDSIKLLVGNILKSLRINGNDTCAMRYLRRALRAYNKYTHEGYYLGDGRARACRPKKPKETKCCRT